MPVPFLGDAMDPEVTTAVYYVTRCCWPQAVRAAMGDIGELWGVLRKGFLEEEVCKLSQEVKIRRNTNHRHSKHIRTSLVTWETPRVAATSTRRGPTRQARCARWCGCRPATLPFLGKDPAVSVKAEQTRIQPRSQVHKNNGPGTRALDLLREVRTLAP